MRKCVSLLNPLVNYNLKIGKSFVANGISYKIDDIADTVGKRYARTDELGIPFAVTIDSQTLQDSTVTLRELVTMKQIRLKVIFNLILV